MITKVLSLVCSGSYWNQHSHRIQERYQPSKTVCCLFCIVHSWQQTDNDCPRRQNMTRSGLVYYRYREVSTGLGTKYTDCKSDLKLQRCTYLGLNYCLQESSCKSVMDCILYCHVIVTPASSLKHNQALNPTLMLDQIQTTLWLRLLNGQQPANPITNYINLIPDHRPTVHLSRFLW